MPLVVTDRATKRFTHSRRHAEQAGKLRIDLLAFGDKVLQVRNLRIDIHTPHLLSMVAMFLGPSIPCHGSVKSRGMGALTSRGSTGGTVLKRNWSLSAAQRCTRSMTCAVRCGSERTQSTRR